MAFVIICLLLNFEESYKIHNESKLLSWCETFPCVPEAFEWC